MRPGIFDPHVHIGNERSFEEEAETETGAAVLGGVTTIGIFLRSLEESYMLHLPAFRRAMDERSYVDQFSTRRYSRRADCRDPLYAKEFGIRSFKFTCRNAGHRETITDDVLLHGFRTVAGLGPDAIACVHCETGALIDRARNELQKKRRARWKIGSLHTRQMPRRWQSRPRSICPKSQARISMSCIYRAAKAWRSCAMLVVRACASPWKRPPPISELPVTIPMVSS